MAAAARALTLVIGYTYGTVSQLGLPAGVAALNTTVAFIIFSSLPITVGQDATQSALLFAGGLLQAVLLMIVWPLERSALERSGLAAAYRELGAYARSLANNEGRSPPIGALSTARQIVADQQPLARAADVARFKRILAEAEALRQRLGALMTLHVQNDARDPAPLARAIGAQLEALAATLEGTTGANELETVRTATLAEFERFEAASTGDRYATAVARDIEAHLRDATQAVAVAASGKPVRFFFSAAPRPSAYIQARIDWFSRDAVRIAVVLAVAMLIGHTAFSATRGYWIALTAALVLRPDFKATIVRGIARIAGTLIGAVVAALAVAASHGDPAWIAVGIVASAAVCYLTIVPNYGIFSLAMTVFVVLSLQMLGTSEQTTILDRVLDTLLGGALAIAGYVAFPSWAHRRTRALLAATSTRSARLPSRCWARTSIPGRPAAPPPWTSCARAAGRSAPSSRRRSTRPAANRYVRIPSASGEPSTCSPRYRVFTLEHGAGIRSGRDAPAAADAEAGSLSRRARRYDARNRRRGAARPAGRRGRRPAAGLCRARGRGRSRASDLPLRNRLCGRIRLQRRYDAPPGGNGGSRAGVANDAGP